ncbi:MULTISPECIES: hypothetical protein [Mycobacteriaceae]|jgi:integrase|uniref:Core-binding (CB) domain-containing protein n=3 Tax=Mycolicibacterium TaxID=1866885 RepID=A0A132PEC4_9MYCO|nr:MULTISPECIES: hypothetical protein [Mycobacteriaceae]KLO47481.1 hypothetical protein ABW05_32525 [Mycolicibacterium senegalense]KWX20689.1 hypothetical protein AFM11_29135 [Mycolicibacterium wolinskyi]
MGERWLTVLSGGTPSAPPKLLAELAWFDSLEGLEAKAGIKPGTPVVIDLGRLHADPENYRTERVFTEFLRTSRWSRLKQGTRTTYATVYPPIIRWLASRSIPKALHEMDANDIAEWKEWRTDPIANEKSISGATWNKEVAALSLFFKWAVTKKYTVENPIEEYGPELKFKGDNTNRATAGGWKSKNARVRRIDWIEPETFRLWSNVAFRGYAVKTSGDGKLVGAGENPSFRGRNTQRNATFVETLYFCGTREGETSLLLTLELPQKSTHAFAEMRLPGSITKTGRSRTIVVPWLVDGLLRRYIQQDRRRAVALGRRHGSYNDARWHKITDHRVKRGKLETQLDGRNTWVSHDQLLGPARRWLLVEAEDGWEPAMLWLTESGLPADERNMIKVIQRATRKWVSLCTAVGFTGSVPYLTAKTLRYSFALNWLIAWHKVIDEELGSPPVAYSPSRYEDAYTAVQWQLGHRDLQTTMDAYLLAVKELRGINIFREATFKSVYEALHSRHESVLPSLDHRAGLDG